MARTGGFRISDGFMSPFDLVEIGMLAEEDAEARALVLTASISGGPRQSPDRTSEHHGRERPPVGCSSTASSASHVPWRDLRRRLSFRYGRFVEYDDCHLRKSGFIPSVRCGGSPGPRMCLRWLL